MTRAVLPAFVAGGAISVALWQTGQLEFLPAMWLTVYGAGALPSSFFAPCSIAWLGASCLVLCVVVLVILPGWPLLTMAVGFVVTHVVFGACVLLAERRPERQQQAGWATLEELT